MNSRSEVNAITPAYASKLGLKVCFIDVRVQKIDGSTLEKFEMVLASFQVENSLEKTRYFQKTFSIANPNAKVILRMIILEFSKVNAEFAK